MNLLVLSIAKKRKTEKPLNESEESGLPFKKEGNAYDKIYTQIAESNFLPIAQEKMGVKFIAWRQLKEKLQHTIETEIEFCYRITKEDGTNAFLHLEFQSNDDHKMIFRMNEYHGMQVKKYSLPIHHFVIYFGENKPTMRTQVLPDEAFTGFELINVGEMNPLRFLDAADPEATILAIFADYPKEQSEDIFTFKLQAVKRIDAKRGGVFQIFQHADHVVQIEKPTRFNY